MKAVVGQGKRLHPSQQAFGVVMKPDPFAVAGRAGSEAFEPPERIGPSDPRLGRTLGAGAPQLGQASGEVVIGPKHDRPIEDLFGAP